MANYFRKENVRDLRVWSSQKIRAVQSSIHLKGIANYIEHWKALDEIDAVSFWAVILYFIIVLVTVGLVRLLFIYV